MVSHSFSLAGFEFFLLILARIISFISVAPFFSQRGVPNRTKIGFAAIVAILILFAIEPERTYEYESAFGYGALVIKEAITGLLIGYAANVCSYIVMFAGNIIDMDIGLSMVSQFDPSQNTQLTITGSIYSQVITVLLIVTNMHQYILRTAIDSFSLIPLGGTVFKSDVLLESMIVYFTDLFVLGFRVMLPIFATILIVNVVLGVMAKVAPQMNMFSIGVQIKIIAGLLVLFILVFLFPEVARLVFKEMSLTMGNIMDGLHD